MRQLTDSVQVVTVLGGLIKLAYNHWQLRKFTKISQQKGEESAMAEQPGLPLPPVRRGRAANVPFGVRAIESGIEVEGVWISRNNSPAPSAPGSPTGSATPIASPTTKGKAADRSSNVPSLSMPEPIHPHAGAAGGSRSRLASPSPDVYSQYDGSISDQRGQQRALSPGGSNVSRGPLPNQEATPRMRPSYKPRHSSHLRFSTGDALQGSMEHETNRRTTVVDDGGFTSNHTYLANTAFTPYPGHQYHFQRSSSGSSDGSNTSNPYVPQHYEPRRPDSSFTNFSLPHANATRTPIDSLPFTRTTAYASSTRSGTESPSRQQQHSPPRSRGGGGNAMANPFSTPLHTPDSDAAPSFQHFMESDPHAGSRQSLPLLDNVDYEASGATGWSNGKSSRMDVGDAPRGMADSRFEVVPSGTLGAADLTGTPEKRQMRKLHKKNGSSHASRDSLFVEQI